MNGVPAQLPLRDIHLPDPVSWWPPAPGWWLLAAVLLLLLGGAVLIWRRYGRGRLRRAARAALQRVFADHRRHGDPQRLLQELSVLLRRIALSYFPRPQVASLSGDAWLGFLDQGLVRVGAQPGFLRGPGRVLAEGPFARDPTPVDSRALERLCRAWVEGLGTETKR